MRRTALCMMALLAAAVVPPCRMTSSAGAEPLAIYVATDGVDGSPGTRTKPFATLERARDAIRALKQKGGLPPGGVTVWLRGGVYYLLNRAILAIYGPSDASRISSAVSDGARRAGVVSMIAGSGHDHADPLVRTRDYGRDKLRTQLRRALT